LTTQAVSRTVEEMRALEHPRVSALITVLSGASGRALRPYPSMLDNVCVNRDVYLPVDALSEPPISVPTK